ncbi:uncharacterized protein LOC103707051 isoform X1 [Phoenix dactylifera]|uniref:Uncharacterized protein LOC103707051 isoform X1 n=1 Tax=Phoenix dactylifera TaxID=42345 RepID=A0A8B9ABB3_PHODC|nr:uncharacterized protein LOC103707051 isoform X1 [Phoenix dactylifera]
MLQSKFCGKNKKNHNTVLAKTLKGGHEHVILIAKAESFKPFYFSLSLSICHARRATAAHRAFSIARSLPVAAGRSQREEEEPQGGMRLGRDFFSFSGLGCFIVCGLKRKNLFSLLPMQRALWDLNQEKHGVFCARGSGSHCLLITGGSGTWSPDMEWVPIDA